MSAEGEVELPRPEKRLRAVDQNQMRDLQNQILAALKDRLRPPARVQLGENPLEQERVASLTRWAHHYDYVLHYKEKRKHFDDVPGDVKHEGRYAKVCTIELYWVNP
jgi:hypothetical protein